MATYRKRGERWTAEVCVKGIRRSKTHPTKAAARSWATEMESKLGAAGDSISSDYLVKDAFKRYSEEVSETKRGARWEVIRFEKLSKEHFATLQLVDLKREDLEAWIDGRLNEVKPSSVNRELNLISSALTYARRWRWMEHNPFEDLKRPKNPPHRDRLVSQGEVDSILLMLSYDEEFPVELQKQRTAVAFLFALETAMRAGEICSLIPSDISLDDRVALLRQTKNGMSRRVPLSSEAVRLLERLQPWPDDDQPLFRLKSGVLSTLFKKAVQAAAISDLTFHDSRHEAITRLAKKLDVLDLARMVGHRDIKQLMTYYNKTAEELAKQLD